MSGLILLGFALILWFIAQLYADSVLWVLSILALAAAIVIPFYIERRRNRVVIALLLSLIVSFNYLFYAVSGGSRIEPLAYAIGLMTVLWLILYLLSAVIRSFMPQKAETAMN
jgi:CDP-diglyceride synthetase